MIGKLSQEEIGALMASAQASEGKTPSSDVELRDFRRPRVCSQDALDKARISFAATTTPIAKSLGDMLQLNVQVNLTALEQARYENILESISIPCCAYRVKMDPNPAPALLSIEPGIALACVDRLLGGSGKAKFEPRELRGTEKPIVDRFAKKMIGTMAQELIAITKFTPSLGAMLGNKSELSFIEGGDAVLLVSFGLSGDLAPGEIRVAIPFANLPSIVSKKAGSMEKKTEARAGALPKSVAGAIASSYVEASAVLCKGHILISDLLMLELGDVIPLETSVAENAEIFIAGVPTYLGRCGVKEGKWALEIDSAVSGGRIGGKK